MEDNTLDFSMDWDMQFGSWGEDLESDKKKNKESMKKRAIADRALKRKIKNEQFTFNASRNLDELAKRPKKNEQYVLVTEKSFNAYALVKSLLSKEHIDELYIAIYRINEATVDALTQLIDEGHIIKANFVISNFFRESKKAEAFAEKLYDFSKNHSDICKVAFVHTHCKICCIRQKDNFYILEGSGNMSDNARIEQYRYENNELVYNFHKQWMDDILDKF